MIVLGIGADLIAAATFTVFSLLIAANYGRRGNSLPR